MPCKIGSTRIGKVNFNIEEHFFHLDENIRKIKETIKDSISRDILNLKSPKWNQSSSLEPNSKPNYKKNLFDIKAGLTDEKVISPMPNKCYKGCEEYRSDFSGI